MEQKQTFDQFLTTYASDISTTGFLLNLVLTGLLAHLLGRLYVRHGNSLSNKSMFAFNFELIAMTTMVIITIVKSSLALSLGLVGALSIVRFRAAIKEPQELAYIFFTIAIGLGFGADQRVVTIIGFGMVVLVLWLKNYLKSNDIHKNLNLTVLVNGGKQATLDNIIQSLTPHCKSLELKRIDENGTFLEASFLVEFTNYDTLSLARNALHQLDESVQISFIDHKTIA